MYCDDKHTDIINKYIDLKNEENKTENKILSTIISTLLGVIKIDDITGQDRQQLLAVNTLIQYPDRINYSLKKIFTSKDLTFSANDKPYNSTRVLSIRLDEYINVTRYQLYKFEICNSQGVVLATSYMSPLQTYSFGDYGYGSERYDYSDYDTAINDVNENNYDDYFKYDNGDKYETDNDDIINIGYDVTGGIPDINSIVGTLNTTITSIGNFMQSVYSMLPMQFMAVIVLGIALIVILRILGR